MLGAIQVIIRPAKNVLGAIRLPGDKSVSHRYAMLGALAQGTTRLTNFSTGADCASTLSCVRQLGCVIRAGQNEAGAGTIEISFLIYSYPIRAAWGFIRRGIQEQNSIFH